MKVLAQYTSVIIVIVASVFLCSTIVTPANCEEGKYIGSAQCKGCHSLPKRGAQYKSWVETKHAMSLEILKAKGEDKNEKCLACHTTGFGKPHAEGAKLDNVGCEACHGPASEWKSIHNKNKEEAIKKGMVTKPTEDTCIKCHNKNSPDFKVFNFEEYSQKGIHKHKEK